MKIKFFIFIIIFFIFLNSCALKYNYAIVKIYNNSSVSLRYKGLLIDEQSGSNPGEMIIKVISPNKERIYANESDSIDITWASFQENVFLNITWGTSNVYATSTGFFTLKDGDIIKLSLDSTSDFHFPNN
ncbi:MAG TPA: hypothetical protein PLE45_09055 [Spirochaetota bacterium]|nr:hypothetical protein [Spirochaetota bacterium]HOL57211.1 hypothetical protein [Spirochaetota bacterium]HPP03562.1 hypothetical protein [Spirochaetota bacterium]